MYGFLEEYFPFPPELLLLCSNLRTSEKYVAKNKKINRYVCCWRLAGRTRFARPSVRLRLGRMDTLSPITL